MNTTKLMEDRRNPKSPLEFAVRIIETRRRFGIEESLVIPENGHGTRWVKSASLTDMHAPTATGESMSVVPAQDQIEIINTTPKLTLK